MKRLVLAALILTTAVGASAQFTSTDTLKYRISLTDKAATTYSIQQPGVPFQKIHRPQVETEAGYRLYRLAGMQEVCRCHTKERRPCACHRKMG